MMNDKEIVIILITRWRGAPCPPENDATQEVRYGDLGVNHGDRSNEVDQIGFF